MSDEPVSRRKGYAGLVLLIVAILYISSFAAMVADPPLVPEWFVPHFELVYAPIIQFLRLIGMV